MLLQPLLIACAPFVQAPNVVNVSRSPVVFHTGLQSALDAAQDGDVLIVHGSAHSSFALDHRSIAIFALPGETVSVAGPVTITNLASDQRVVLSGLSITSPNTSFQSQPAPSAVTVSASSGSVWLQDCVLKGGSALGHTSESGGAGVSVVGPVSLVLVNTSATGGMGAMDSGEFGNWWPGSGGNGAWISSAARAAIYGGTYRGGRGGEDTLEYGGGDAGSGLAVFWGSQLLAASATCFGGDGGDSALYPASGGAGVSAGQATAALLSCVAFGGHGGTGSSHSGPDGSPVSGNVTTLSAQARLATIPALVRADALTPIGFQGVDGDRMWLASSTIPGWRLHLPSNGVWTTTYPPKLPLAPLAMLPSSGATTADWRTPNLNAPGSTTVFVQAFCLPESGGAVLGTPGCMAVIDPALGADCNGNGVFDVLDIIEGVPDTNRNWVPDTCELLGTIYVDDSAPAGGIGTFVAPFQTIQDGLDVAVTGNTVVVLDGTYSGPRNRDLDFLGSGVRLTSANGAANCVIDCQALGRAFHLRTGEPEGAEIDGFTIQNGRASPFSAGGANGSGLRLANGAQVRIENCTFSQCSPSIDALGGAICITSTSLGATIVDSTFVDNSSGHAGGAISVASDSTILRCQFVHNEADVGGAISVEACGLAVSHSTFIGNHASSGGALDFVEPFGVASLRVSNSLLAGNYAELDGGAIRADGSFDVSHTTLVGNATPSAGAIGGGGVHAVSGQSRLLDSVLWQNASATSDGQVLLTGASLAIDYCDLDGGQSGIHVAAGNLQWGTGNLALDPKFTDPNGPDGDPATFGDNVDRLMSTSPCLDAGDAVNALADVTDVDGDGDFGELVPLDLNLKARFKDLPSVPDTGIGSPPIDLGCYERQN